MLIVLVWKLLEIINVPDHLLLILPLAKVHNLVADYKVDTVRSPVSLVLIYLVLIRILRLVRQSPHIIKILAINRWLLLNIKDKLRQQLVSVVLVVVLLA